MVNSITLFDNQNTQFTSSVSESKLRAQISNLENQRELELHSQKQSGVNYGSNNVGKPVSSRVQNLENRLDQLSKQLRKLEQQRSSISTERKSPNECETCKNRKYQDGSDEMVSFKSPAHISPQAAGSAVRAHEQEHVANAYKKANEGNGKVIQASVQIHTAICPECGRSYVAGGTTSTQIKYYNEDNPYQQDLKKQDESKYAGMNINAEL